jgi:1A family penicillin-binding protein
MPIPHLKTRKRDAWQDYRSTRGIKNPRSKLGSKRKRLIKFLLPRVIGLGIILVAIAFIYVLIVSRSLPNPNQLIQRQVAQSTKIYDRTGENILYEISGDEKRTLVTLQEIPTYVKQATVAIEDKNFYKHGGFSLWAMFRTVITNVIYHRSAGGSTLTQQFIKNAVLTPEKTISRKIKELIMSYRLEKKFSKDEILQMYLNEIPYGSNAYGVQAASQKYFGKNVQTVSLAEAAVLAAIVQVPSRYSPYGPNKDILLSRKDYVLDLMVEQGYISEAERDTAKNEEIKFKGPETNITAPHFVMYIKDILAEKYGEKMVEQEGLKIYTTLDLYKQKIAEETIAERTKDYPTKYNANNAALVSLDPKTGQILAMVGSRDYFNDEIDGQVNVATRPRQPGSSMKPIVYAALFDKGYTPDTILYDVVTNFSTDPAQPYEPHNYSGKELGPVTIRQALAGSLNIPAVKAIYLAGINSVIDLAENLGYTTLFPRSRFGLSLVLGGGEVKLLEHTNAYSAFARDGQISPITSILKIEDKDGNVLEEYKPNDKKVLNPQIARMINSILSDNAARTYIFGAKNYLNLGDRPVGAKTGTTNDYHDAWTMGYTPSLVTGVWVGNSDNKAMKGAADGSVLAAPIWHDYMAKVLGDTPKENFKTPDDYKTSKAVLDGELSSEIVMIDLSSGLLATSSTPPELIERRSVPAYHSILYYVNKDDPRGPASLDPTSDPQFKLWESAVIRWASQNATSSTSTLPVNYDEFHRPENQPVLDILFPANNQTVDQFALTVEITASATRGITRTEYYLNNNLWETRWGDPSSFTKSISFLTNGYQTLRVKTCDDIDNCTEKSINFNLLIKGNPVSAGKNSVRILSPSSGFAAGSIDFPINVNAQIGKPDRVARLDLVLRDQTSGQTEILANISNQISNNLTLVWNTYPGPKSGGLYLNLYDWNGSVIKSNELRFTIN